MIDLLLVGRERGYGRLREAIEKILAMGCSDVSAVLLMLKAGEEPKREVLEAVEIGGLSRYDRPQPTTSMYDQLLCSYADTGVIQ
jgi:sirohydrochlorin ferrochelatase